MSLSVKQFHSFLRFISLSPTFMYNVFTYLLHLGNDLRIDQPVRLRRQGQMHRDDVRGLQQCMLGGGFLKKEKKR